MSTTAGATAFTHASNSILEWYFVIPATRPFDAVLILSQIKTASKGLVAGMTKYHSKMEFDACVKAVAPAVVDIDTSETTSQLFQKFHAVGINIHVQILGVNQN